MRYAQCFQCGECCQIANLDANVEFYNGAIGQFYGFKDEFRNEVMHVRRTYDRFDSERALVRVRDFMQKLAGRINQKGAIVKDPDAWLGL